MTIDELEALPDLERRRLLVAGTAAMGAAGVLAAATPFIQSWNPSERTRAVGGPIEIDVSRIEPGAMLTVPWRHKPVWVLRRTPQMLAQVAAARPLLLDPASSGSIQPGFASNELRALNPEFMVLLGVCTHLGCTPSPRFQAGDLALGPDWPGGFFCQCHGSKYDLAGRVFRGVPAPSNMTVPPYRFVGNDRLVIGEDDGQRRT
ncbi:MAG: ubiquinol-cytochrome c reductase iron-sulfur subunit [Steroidobacteraceae bacterium]|jgi:ubiquinol-cytochrome c reductase iron-sulfur subunit